MTARMQFLIWMDVCICSCMCFSIKNSMVKCYLRKSPVEFSSVWLWLKILTSFEGITWTREDSAVLSRVTLMSLSLLKGYLLCFAAAWEGFLDVRLSYAAGEAIFMLSFWIAEHCRVSPICKMKGVESLLVCFFNHCLCLNCKFFGTDISARTVSVVISFCLDVGPYYYEESASPSIYLTLTLYQKQTL